MTSPTIAVGLPEALSEWASAVGVDPGRLRVITVGVLPVAGVAHWVGVPTPDPAMVHVQLHAPEPVQGEAPRWLEFRPREWRPDVVEAFCCWTSDLAAVCVR